jgi:hypothetical protein
LDPARIRGLANAALPDRHRWGNPSSYKPDWDDRSKLVAPLIPDGANVLEIGAGTGNLRKLIEHRCNYVGADLVPLDSDIRCLDLESDPLPHECYDCIVLLGVFEYLHKTFNAAEKIASATDHAVISYCCVRDNAPDAIEIRNQRGWVNHFSEIEFTGMFALFGLGAASRTTANSDGDFEQIVFEFRRRSQR